MSRSPRLLEMWMSVILDGGRWDQAQLEDVPYIHVYNDF